MTIDLSFAPGQGGKESVHKRIYLPHTIHFGMVLGISDED